jgi:hypothetical protein
MCFGGDSLKGKRMTLKRAKRRKDVEIVGRGDFAGFNHQKRADATL